MPISEVDASEADRPVAAHFDEATITVELADGRRVTTPLWWYPRLLNATPSQRQRVCFSRYGVHWDEIDEDLSVEGMLKGWKAKGAIPPGSAA